MDISEFLLFVFINAAYCICARSERDSAAGMTRISESAVAFGEKLPARASRNRQNARLIYMLKTEFFFSFKAIQ